MKSKFLQPKAVWLPFLLGGMVAMLASCHIRKKINESAVNNNSNIEDPNGWIPTLGPYRSPMAQLRPIIIYQTNGNYDDLVPVTMNDGKTEIISYPDPSDLTPDSKPIHLRDGYLFDQRGVGRNTVFLSLTYEEYAKLKTPPSLTQLMNLIKIKNPFSKIIVVDRRNLIYQSRITPECLNEYIEKGMPGAEIVVMN